MIKEKYKINFNQEKPHNGIMKIGKPYVKKTGHNKSRLCTMLTYENKDIELYIEVDNEYSQYLTPELSDPFILGVIEKAMKHGYDIHFSQPMSEDLYYNLTTYMIPVYARNLPYFNEIDLIGKTTNEKIESENKAGTGFSGGVDSFYTVLKHLHNNQCEAHNVSHLLIAVNGAATTGISEDIDEEWLNATGKKMEPAAEELGLKLILVNSNIDMLYLKDRCLDGDAITTASFVYALQKLFGIYYWASAYQAEMFKFTQEDGGWFENVSVKYCSTRSILFYHSGSETNRIGKEKYIADNSVVQKSLTVCGDYDAKNCGRCFKCLRTMAELNSLGKLEKFDGTFDVKDYKKHFTKRFAEELAIDHPPFTTDILTEMKKNNIHFSPAVFPISVLFYKPLHHLREYLKDKAWARKVYYKFDLDEKVSGKRQSDEQRAARLRGLGK